LGEPQSPSLTENPRYFWNLLRAAVDYTLLNTETGREMMRRAKPYPDPFVFSHLKAHAGAELGCWVAMNQEPGPLILFVPGTFATKDATNTRAKVLRIQEETGGRPPLERVAELTGELRAATDALDDDTAELDALVDELETEATRNGD
jgi:hypothetical protein